MTTSKLYERAARAAAALLLLLFLLSGTSVCHALEGRGTEEEPYLIYTVEDLNKALGPGFTDKSGHYRLANDIDAGDEELYLAGDSVPISYLFTGVFNGAGHKITYHCTSHDLWQFGVPSGRTKGCLFDTNYGTIKNLIVEGVIDFAFEPTERHGNWGAGGIVYENCGLIENCISRVNISAKIQPNWTPWGHGLRFIDMPGIGGIAARSVGARIVNCAYTGTISVDNSAVMMCEDFGDDYPGYDGMKPGAYVNGMVGGIVGVTGERRWSDGYGGLIKKGGVNDSCVFTGHIVLSEEIHKAANGTGVGPIWGHDAGAAGENNRVWDTARITAGGVEFRPEEQNFPGREGLEKDFLLKTLRLRMSVNNSLMGDLRPLHDVSQLAEEEERSAGSSQWFVRTAKGAAPEFLISPSAGYSVKYAALDGTNLGPLSSYRFTSPLTEDGHTLSVFFSPEGGSGFTPVPVVSPIELTPSAKTRKVSALAAADLVKLPSEVQSFAEKDASGTVVTDPLAARVALGPDADSLDLGRPILTMPLTLCKADKGDTVLTAWQCSLSGYAGEKASDIKIFAMLSSERTAELRRADTAGAISEGEFALTDADGREITADAVIEEDEIYFVNVALKDNEKYDLDPEEGEMLFALFAAKEKETGVPDDPDAPGGGAGPKSSSGCDAGLGSLALLALAPFALRRKK
ncbi:Synerg-CTERM sorting domain-containing protein [Synergistes jonesii]|uniref:Synerg-CTERM sorting domain-containing protein n=1 Tax=Synergistes jonesii TaxID=2754 RepID=UPI00332ADD3C